MKRTGLAAIAFAMFAALPLCAQTTQPQTPEAPAQKEYTSVEWLHDLGTAIQAAKAENKPILFVLGNSR